MYVVDRKNRRCIWYLWVRLVSERLNPRILEKLEESECEDILKNFIKTMLYFELENLELGRPAYKKYYDSRIEKSAQEYFSFKNEVDEE